MAAVEVPQTLEYRGGQLNAAPVLEVENFTNWKKRFMCHIIDNSNMSITSSNIPKLFETEDSTLPNQDTDEKLDEPIFGPKTIKSLLKSKSTFKAETLKGITINEPSSAPARGKSSSASKTNSAPAGKLKNMKMEDDPPLAIVMKELNELKLQISKKKSSYSRNKNAQQCKRTNHRTCSHAEFMSLMNANQHHTSKDESSSRSRPSRPLVSFSSYIHCRYNDHHSNDFLYYPTCEICGSYDHDTHGHNKIISLRRGINPRNPQHITKNYETCGSNVHTTSYHNDIKWFRKRENLQAKNAKSFKASKNDSSNDLRSKTPTKRYEEEVSAKGTLRKSLLPPRCRLLMAQIIQCLGVKTRGFDQITNKDAIILYSLANGINIDYANIFWEDIIIKLNKKQREKFIPYTRFLSLLIMHKMKEGYRDDKVTLYPTQVFSVNNWALKPNQPEELPFTGHMLAICAADKPVVFKAPKTSSKAESVSQGTKPGAQTGHNKTLTSSKQPYVSSKEATKGGSYKAPTGSKTGHSKKRKESSSAMDSNPSQPSVSTPLDTGMHKEDQQATGGPTSLGATSEARANPQLSSGMSAFNLNEPIYSASFIIHSKSASGNDASAASIAEADPGNSAPSDFVSQQHGMNEGTKNTSYDHLFVGTDPHVLADQSKSVSEGLETILTYPIIRKGSSSVASQIVEETSSIIKLKDLANLVSHVQPRFKDLDSPKDDHVIVVNDSDEDEDDEVHATKNCQKYKLELEKNKAEAEVGLLEAQPSFPNVEPLKELLVKFLKIEFSNILSAHDFSSSLPTELKDLPSKFNDQTEETVTSLTSQLAELKTLQWELPTEFLVVPLQVEMIQAKLKTLNALPSLLNKVTNALNQFAHAITSKKTGGDCVPSVGQARTQPAKGEKNTNQATISHLFQRRAEKEHLNKQQPKPTTPIITTTTTQMQSLFPQKAVKENTESDSDNDETQLSGSRVESSRIKNKIKEEAKAEAAKCESEIRKEELIDLLGPEVVNNYYNDKL
ncbi:hypothetical protein Tco_0746155 [Tanacetum coccineum]